MESLNILISNDDGVFAEGIRALAKSALKKGHKVYIEGKLKTRSWQDQDGNNKYSTEVITDNLTMLGSANLNDSKSNFGEQQINKIELKKSSEKEFSAPGEDDDLPF